MNITTSQAHGRVPITIFHLAGRLALDTAPALQQAAQVAFDNGTRYLLIDLTALEAITSNGLSALHTIYASFTDKSSQQMSVATRNRLTDQPFKSPHVKLLNPVSSVRRVLEMTGFDIFLEIHDNLQEAIASF